MEIIHEREKCIGCGSCQALCPKYWNMGKDGKADLLGYKTDPENGKDILEVDSLGCNGEAAEICPVQCIKVKK